eukprot:TRINITY_DN5542_c0_g1_i1.p1 TRINITY_DN5542_c0_g1~~TRINITY_DN5542_c0_g1_i1.p1  ORF type:complete len:500 (+),score=109.18 TRINITY_DN5542_c0_g1_i1:181-1680(+)
MPALAAAALAAAVQGITTSVTCPDMEEIALPLDAGCSGPLEGPFMQHACRRNDDPASWSAVTELRCEVADLSASPAGSKCFTATKDLGVVKLRFGNADCIWTSVRKGTELCTTDPRCGGSEGRAVVHAIQCPHTCSEAPLQRQGREARALKWWKKNNGKKWWKYWGQKEYAPLPTKYPTDSPTGSPTGAPTAGPLPCVTTNDIIDITWHDHDGTDRTVNISTSDISEQRVLWHSSPTTYLEFQGGSTKPGGYLNGGKLFVPGDNSCVNAGAKFCFRCRSEFCAVYTFLYHEPPRSRASNGGLLSSMTNDGWVPGGYCAGKFWFNHTEISPYHIVYNESCRYRMVVLRKNLDCMEEVCIEGDRPGDQAIAAEHNYNILYSAFAATKTYDCNDNALTSTTCGTEDPGYANTCEWNSAAGKCEERWCPPKLKTVLSEGHFNYCPDPPGYAITTGFTCPGHGAFSLDGLLSNFGFAKGEAAQEEPQRPVGDSGQIAETLAREV